MARLWPIAGARLEADEALGEDVASLGDEVASGLVEATQRGREGDLVGADDEKRVLVSGEAEPA